MEPANQNGSRLAFLCDVTEEIGVTNAWIQSWKDNKPGTHEYACLIWTEEEGEGGQEEERVMQASLLSQGGPQNSTHLDTWNRVWEANPSLLVADSNSDTWSWIHYRGAAPPRDPSPVLPGKKWSTLFISGTMPRLCREGAGGVHKGVFAGFYLRKQMHPVMGLRNHLLSLKIRQELIISVSFASFRIAFCPTQTCCFC